MNPAASHRVSRLLALLIAAGVAVSCGSTDPLTDLKAFVQEQDAKPKGSIEPPPQFSAPDFVSYTASSKRSPFEVPRPVELIQEERDAPRSNVKPNLQRVKEYLETFRIESIAMVGTISGYTEDVTLWALVKDGQGEVHRVKAGNYLGRNFGRIIEISETQIVLMEIVPTGKENWVERPRVLILVGLGQ
ncbi:pilus assembly protein PilP [Reinekea sp.]|jgi:type IV pilus assembly protein PilP|uniref:pilus assembly protein PilP n=1 Tax=Reinekea sp. TaxID=1970455 RepID=UPI002A819DA3|nr:pilus assembly protein PilP [Reinekea sp.]